MNRPRDLHSDAREREHRDLVAFLQRHRPSTPPAAEDLSDRIMAQIEILDRETTAPQPRVRAQLRTHRRLVWLAPAAIAAAAMVTWLTARPALEVADIDDIEAAMIASWQATTDGLSDPDDESFALFTFDSTDEF
ncbi:MAG: hypothetical protein AAF704_05210 [Cyanobacteria bacterium P01_D01_bin.123]